MLDDVFSQLASCQSAICLGWHAAMMVGGLALGLWLAHEFWGRTREASKLTIAPATKLETSGLPGVQNGPEDQCLSTGLVESVFPRQPGPLKSFLRETFVFQEGSGSVSAEANSRMPSRAPREDPIKTRSCAYEFDLTLVRGINRAIARGLKEEGIGSLADLAICPRGKWRDITGLLLLGELPFRERWQDQARELMRHVDAISGRTRLPAPRAIAPELIGEWFAGERVVAHVSLGPVFDAMPGLVDRLTEVEGITADTALALGSMGIWRFKQVGLWTAVQVAEVSRRLNLRPNSIEEDAWISRAMLRHLDSYRGSPIWAEPTPEGWQYRELLRQYPVNDFIQADNLYGVVYLETPSSADNLTQIRGIDGAVAESLRRAGIQRFRQIADWSEANVDAFTSRLSLVPGRIYTERWIAQADGLCGGWTV